MKPFEQDDHAERLAFMFDRQVLKDILEEIDLSPEAYTTVLQALMLYQLEDEKAEAELDYDLAHRK